MSDETSENIETEETAPESVSPQLVDSNSALTRDEAREQLTLAGSMTIEFYEKPFEDDGFIPNPEGSGYESYVVTDTGNVNVYEMLGSLLSAVYSISMDTVREILENGAEKAALGEDLIKKIEDSYADGAAKAVAHAFQSLTENLGSLAMALENAAGPEREESEKDDE